jgi:hypothetical protein
VPGAFLRFGGLNTAQEIEATALRLFHANGPLRALRTRPAEGPVITAEVIAHDVKASVLMLEDLGPLGTLWDLLSEESCSVAEEGDVIEDGYWDLGLRIGAFFAALHSEETLKKVAADVAVAETLTHNLTGQLIYDAAVTPLLDRMTKYNVADAESLFARVAKGYKEPVVLDRFILGDCHPGSFLIQGWKDLPFKEDGDQARTVAVIDWEFAHLQGDGVAGDISQLLASLYCQLLSVEPETKRWNATYSLMQGIANGYGMAADFNRKEFAESEPGQKMRLLLLRRAMILFGRETINQTFEREDAWSTDPATLNQMVDEGAKYLRFAGDDTEGMMKNWDEIRNHDYFLLNLFGWGKQAPEPWPYMPPTPFENKK